MKYIFIFSDLFGLVNGKEQIQWITVWITDWIIVNIDLKEGNVGVFFNNILKTETSIEIWMKYILRIY